MCDDINEIAARANIVFADVPGFINCEVEGDMPQILTYQFGSALEAEHFRLTQSTLDTGFTYEIPTDRLTIVLEHR